MGASVKEQADGEGEGGRGMVAPPGRELIQAPPQKWGQASGLRAVQHPQSQPLNSDPSSSELGVAVRERGQVSQGRQAFKGDASCPQDFFCKLEEADMAPESLLPPGGTSSRLVYPQTADLLIMNHSRLISCTPS